MVVRRLDGRPVVIENEPHLRDGTPMPTLYWLVDPELHDAVSRLEGEGGVHRFEELVDAETSCDARTTSTPRAAARDRAQRTSSRPRAAWAARGSGVKCLHAHLANYLVGADDPGRRAGRAEDRRAGTTGRWTSVTDAVAALDCGSNSTRLLIVDREPTARCAARCASRA